MNPGIALEMINKIDGIEIKSKYKIGEDELKIIYPKRFYLK